MGTAAELQSVLHELRACCWDTTSCDRDEVARVEAAAATHGADAAYVRSCQRTEVYHRLAACGCGAPVQLGGKAALRHLAEVAAGLHSVVLGEPEILGQVRSALRHAPPWVRRLGDLAVAAARDVRATAHFAGHSGHLLDRALRTAAVPPEGRAAVLGVGQMGRLVAQRARELGFEPVVVVSRRPPEGRWFLEGRFEFWPLDHLRELLPVDVLATCLGSSANPLDAARDLPTVRRLIVDLGTPRNLAGEAPVPLLTIRDLLLAERPRGHGALRRRDLCAQVASALDRRLAMAAEDSDTLVGRFRRRVEALRQAEAARIRALHPELSAETIDTITKSLVNRLFHAPSERVRRAPPELAEELLRLLDPRSDEEG